MLTARMGHNAGIGREICPLIENRPGFAQSIDRLGRRIGILACINADRLGQRPLVGPSGHRHEKAGQLARRCLDQRAPALENARHIAAIEYLNGLDHIAQGIGFKFE